MKNIIIYFSLAILLYSCTSKKENSANPSPAGILNTIILSDTQRKNAGVELSSFIKKTINATLKVNGKIDVPPQNLVSVCVPMGGYLKSTKLLPGMPVKKGEVIALIEDQEYVQIQENYLLTKSKLYYAEKEYNRQRELNQSQASSDKIAQQAESEYKNYRIQLSALNEKLKLINIDADKLTENTLSKTIPLYSPISGFVSKINVNIGKYINSTDIIFDLVNPSDIHLNLKIYEKDIDKIAISKRVLAYSNANPDKKYKCEIILISKDVNSDGTTEVHCHFDQYDHSLVPGMYMNGELQIQSASVNALPEESIVQFDGLSYIFIQKANNLYEMREVKIGNRENGYVEILDAEMYNNPTIVTKGAYSLLMKLKNKEE